jgi:Holliday junction DNA helicase RuvB
VVATTRVGLLLLRFATGLASIHRLEFYTPEDTQHIVIRSAKILKIQIDSDGAYMKSLVVQGNARIANTAAASNSDYAQVKAGNRITLEVAKVGLVMLEVDEQGLDFMDRNLLLTIIEKFEGGPVGLDTLAAAISEEKDTIEDVYEPFLIQCGYLERTPRGRKATKLAYEHFGKSRQHGEQPRGPTAPQQSLW